MSCCGSCEYYNPFDSVCELRAVAKTPASGRGCGEFVMTREETQDDDDDDEGPDD